MLRHCVKAADVSKDRAASIIRVKPPPWIFLVLSDSEVEGHHVPSKRPGRFTQRHGATSPITRIFYNEVRGFPKSLQCPDNTSITSIQPPSTLFPIHKPRVYQPPTFNVNAKFFLCMAWRCTETAEVQHHSFSITWPMDGGKWSLWRPGRLTPRK